MAKVKEAYCNTLYRAAASQIHALAYDCFAVAQRRSRKEAPTDHPLVAFIIIAGLCICCSCLCSAWLYSRQGKAIKGKSCHLLRGESPQPLGK